MIRQPVHFRFEGHQYAVAHWPPEGFEPLGRFEARRVLADLMADGRHRASCAAVVERLLDARGEGSLGIRRDPATQGYRNAPDRSDPPVAVWRRVVVRGPQQLHPYQIPRLLELVSTLREDDAWIEVLVVDEDDEPIAHQQYEIRLSDGRTRSARTNEHGILRYEWLPDGDCEISLVGLDEGAWDAA